jgi:acetyltransferase-like isoleucine patch superfamily enzyme
VIDPTAFLHPRALVDEGATIGPRTRVWAFAHVLSGAVIGADCNLCDHTFVEGGVVVGDRVTVKSGVYLWNGLIVEDDVFLGPCAAFTNDLRPRSRRYPEAFPRTLLRRGASIGANATVLPELTIGGWSLVGAGAVVTRDVPDHAQVVGNPARISGWVCRCGERLGDEDGDRLRRCSCGRGYRSSASGGLEETGDGT